jgi:hypothetical protein
MSVISSLATAFLTAWLGASILPNGDSHLLRLHQLESASAYIHGLFQLLRRLYITIMASQILQEYILTADPISSKQLQEALVTNLWTSNGVYDNSDKEFQTYFGY